MWCSVHFDFEMGLAPQRRALFRHLNVEKCSVPVSFLHFWLRNVQLLKAVWDRQFFLHFWLRSVLRATTACNCSSLLASWLRTRRFSEPTFRPSGATNNWKNTVFRDFPTFSRICIFFLLTLSLLLSSLFYSSLLSDSSHLCFSSVHIVGSLTSKLPSIIIRFLSIWWHGKSKDVLKHPARIVWLSNYQSLKLDECLAIPPLFTGQSCFPRLRLELHGCLKWRYPSTKCGACNWHDLENSAEKSGHPQLLNGFKLQIEWDFEANSGSTPDQPLGFSSILLIVLDGHHPKDGANGYYWPLDFRSSHFASDHNPRGSNKNTIFLPVDLDESKGPIVLGMAPFRSVRSVQCVAGRGWLCPPELSFRILHNF